jgi:hypothetical protein
MIDSIVKYDQNTVHSKTFDEGTIGTQLNLVEPNVNTFPMTQQSTLNTKQEEQLSLHQFPFLRDELTRVVNTVQRQLTALLETVRSLTTNPKLENTNSNHNPKCALDECVNTLLLEGVENNISDIDPIYGNKNVINHNNLECTRNQYINPPDKNYRQIVNNNNADEYSTERALHHTNEYANSYDYCYINTIKLHHHTHELLIDDLKVRELVKPCRLNHKTIRLFRSQSICYTMLRHLNKNTELMKVLLTPPKAFEYVKRKKKKKGTRVR